MRFLIRLQFILLLLSFTSFRINAQLNIQVGESFLSGKTIKEVFVCVEDHSVWAVDNQGNVYSKLISQNDFALFQPTQGHVVTGLTGFNADEMYFAAGSKMIQVIRGEEGLITLPFSGVTSINDVSVIHGNEFESYNQQLSYKDFVAIATNKDLYYLLRNDANLNFVLGTYGNTPNQPDRDWQIKQKSYANVELRYRHLTDYCGIPADHVTASWAHSGTLYDTRNPNSGVYPAEVNASVFAHRLYDPYVNSGYAARYSIWATNSGVYMKDMYVGCADIRRRLNGEVVNDLTEVRALAPIVEQGYIFAATNTGVYYTPESIFLVDQNTPRFLDFKKISSFPSNLKATSISVETDLLGLYRYTSYLYLCQKVAWVGTSSGVYKLYLTLDQEKFNNIKFGSFGVNKPMVNTDYSNPVYDICNGQSLTVLARIQEVFSNQILIKWFKDGVEIPQLLGQLRVELDQPGVYTATITALCENITFSSVPITLKTNAPEITFAYNNDIYLCIGENFPLQTKSVSGYSYRWYKDNVLINGAISNSYTPSTTGNYRVEVSSCIGSWTSSNAVKVNFSTLPPNVVAAQRIDYCVGESAVIKVDNPSNYTIKWFRNEIEQPQYAGLSEISTQIQGNYKARLLSGNCSTVALNKNVVFNAKPTTQLSTLLPQSVCAGETLSLSVPRNQGETYLWSNGQTGNEIHINQSGSYNVKVTNASGCSITSQSVSVTVRPRLLLAKPEAQQICIAGKETTELIAPDGYAKYRWNGITGLKKFTVASPGSYLLEVEDVFGCKASVEYEVKSFCKDIIIPNTFSPNGDGINDLWKVSGLENDGGAKISIYARSGELVYETTGKNPVWNGKIKNLDAPIGVYYYVIKTKISQDILKGSLLIIR